MDASVDETPCFGTKKEAAMWVCLEMGEAPTMGALLLASFKNHPKRPSTKRQIYFPWVKNHATAIRRSVDPHALSVPVRPPGAACSMPTEKPRPSVQGWEGT